MPVFAVQSPVWCILAFPSLRSGSLLKASLTLVSLGVFALGLDFQVLRASVGKLTRCHADSQHTTIDVGIYSASGVFMLAYALVVNGIERRKKRENSIHLVSHAAGGRAFQFDTSMDSISHIGAHQRVCLARQCTIKSVYPHCHNAAMRPPPRHSSSSCKRLSLFPTGLKKGHSCSVWLATCGSSGFIGPFCQRVSQPLDFA